MIATSIAVTGTARQNSTDLARTTGNGDAMEPGRLSPALDATRSALWAQGFAVMAEPGFPPDLLDTVRAAVESLVAGHGDATGTVEVFDLRRTVPAVAELARRCRHFAELLLGRRAVRCTSDELFTSLPGFPEGTPWHQDDGCGPIGRLGIPRPDTSITFWIPLQPVTPANGTLMYLPKSHRDGLRRHITVGRQQLIPDCAGVEGVSVPLEVGTCVVHNGLVVHRANPNRTTSARSALGVKFRPSLSQLFHRHRPGYEFIGGVI